MSPFQKRHHKCSVGALFRCARSRHSHPTLMGSGLNSVRFPPPPCPREDRVVQELEGGETFQHKIFRRATLCGIPAEQPQSAQSGRLHGTCSAARRSWASGSCHCQPPRSWPWLQACRRPAPPLHRPLQAYKLDYPHPHRVIKCVCHNTLRGV